MLAKALGKIFGNRITNLVVSVLAWSSIPFAFNAVNGYPVSFGFSVAILIVGTTMLLISRFASDNRIKIIFSDIVDAPELDVWEILVMIGVLFSFVCLAVFIVFVITMFILDLFGPDQQKKNLLEFLTSIDIMRVALTFAVWPILASIYRFDKFKSYLYKISQRVQRGPRGIAFTRTLLSVAGQRLIVTASILLAVSTISWSFHQP